MIITLRGSHKRTYAYVIQDILILDICI